MTPKRFLGSQLKYNISHHSHFSNIKVFLIQEYKETSAFFPMQF